MLSAVLIAGIPTWLLVVAALVVVAVLVFSLLKRLFKLAILVAAIALAVWLGLTLFEMFA